MRRNSSRIFRGNKGALRVPLLSFQYLRRPRCAAKLLCYHIVGEFESHRLHHLKVHCVIDKADQAGYPVKKPKKPGHAFRVLYATRRHQNGVDIETLRQELGHSDISTTQIYLRSADGKSDKHRGRIKPAKSRRGSRIASS
jgi:integrase